MVVQIDDEGFLISKRGRRRASVAWIAEEAAGKVEGDAGFKVVGLSE